MRSLPSNEPIASGIPVAEIISALSFALDLTEDAVPGHALRSCLIGMRLAAALGLGDADRSHLFYALLLKDIGCSSNAARLFQIMGSDERRIKREDKLEDWTRTTWSSLRHVWQNLHPEASHFTRLKRLIDIGRRDETVHGEMVALRCDRGAKIVASIGLPKPVSLAVRHLDEHWDGSGFPGGLKGEAIPLFSRILLVAQHLDVFATERGEAAALRSLKFRTGRWFDPDLVRAAGALSKAGLLWGFRGSIAESRAAVLDLEPGQRLVASNDQIDALCDAFADVVDVKSSFTASHSRGVAE
ncbi:MAG TPA: HD domain-containing phosphohydrolase, partial [Acidobacteriaceae bacterium]|nr:HD domain-containing phosphohydrolase [Acidobacteriaceae bacterium]